MLKKVVVSWIFVLIALSAFGSTGDLVRINGAGATFPYPLYSKWFFEYNKNNKDVQFNYQSIGSGGGIRQLIKQTVDFGASDAPMSPKDTKKVPWKVRHIPTVVGAVAIGHNIEGVKDGLMLDGSTLADIFLGKIKKWNDPRLKALNPTVSLPDSAILVVRRADGSGTTDVFSDYLSTVSADWKKKVGRGKTLRWPTGIGAKGNDGVTAQIKNNVGAIGYIELAYALKNGIPTAAIKNSDNQFIRPNIQSISSSAFGIEDVGEGISIVNSSASGSYPISAFTYILLPEPEKDSVKLSRIRTFLRWALTEGQRYAAPLHYAPLPKQLAKGLLKTIGPQ